MKFNKKFFKTIYFILIFNSIIFSDDSRSIFSGLSPSANQTLSMTQSDSNSLKQPIAHDASSNQQVVKKIEEKFVLDSNIEPFQKDNPEDQGLDSFVEKKHKDNQLVMFQFDNASLENVVKYIEDTFKVKFFADDAINPMMKNGGGIQGHKLTFRTNSPLKKSDAWRLFTKFLDISGLSIIPTEIDDLFRITSTTNANQEPLPTYFDIDPELIPDTSDKIRYVFFVKNNAFDTIFNVTSQLSSLTAKITQFSDLNAIILTDKAINIKSLMKIIKEFDSQIPEVLSVLKLKKSDAKTVAAFYYDLTKTDVTAARNLPNKKQSDVLYFPMNARVIPEPRTNSLILLGTRESVARIEEFIVKFVDVDLDLPYSPLHVYDLQYTSAVSMSQILNSVISFGQGSDASQYGGIRDGMKYFKNVSITPETTGNRLIIKADESDFFKIKEILTELDVRQPQVAIEVLIVDVSIDDKRAMGTHFRKKDAGSLLPSVDYQFAGLGAAPQVNNTTGSLMTTLAPLLSGATYDIGSTLLSIGNNAVGIWGILKILKTYAQTNIISNPFLLTTNKYQANVQLGSTRRIKTGQVALSSSSMISTQGDQSANLSVTITPQISINGMIQLNINILMEEFASSVDSSGNKTIKSIKTMAMVGDQEVLVLGGLVKSRESESYTPFPFPVLSWFLKTKSKTIEKSNLLIFIAPKIVSSSNKKDAFNYTCKKAGDSKKAIAEFDNEIQNRDPLNRMFFGDHKNDYVRNIDNFLNQDSSYNLLDNVYDKKTKNVNKKNLNDAKENKVAVKDKKKLFKNRKNRYKNHQGE